MYPFRNIENRHVHKPSDGSRQRVDVYRNSPYDTSLHLLVRPSAGTAVCHGSGQMYLSHWIWWHRLRLKKDKHNTELWGNLFRHKYNKNYVSVSKNVTFIPFIKIYFFSQQTDRCFKHWGHYQGFSLWYEHSNISRTINTSEHKKCDAWTWHWTQTGVWMFVAGGGTYYFTLL